jgi:hypothetical protein
MPWDLLDRWRDEDYWPPRGRRKEKPEEASKTEENENEIEEDSPRS